MKEIAYVESCPTTKTSYNVKLDVMDSKWQAHLDGDENVTAELKRAGQKKLEAYFAAVNALQLGFEVMVEEDELDCSIVTLYDINA